MIDRILKLLPPNLPELASVWALKIFISALILIGFICASLLVRKLITGWERHHTDPQRVAVLDLIGGIARISLVILGFITATGTLGINVSALVAGLGLTGFALGFAFRDALSNVLAGIMILFYHPFHRGDRVTITGLEGRVTKIDLRYTTLQNEEKTYLIPNSILLTNAITVTRS